MAKDGTRRGGARIGSGPKTSKISPPLIDFDANFDDEKDDFEVKNGKKSAEKCKKSADLGAKTSEKAAKTSKNSPKTAPKTTKKSKTASKTQEKSTSVVEKPRKPVKKTSDKADTDDIPELEGVDVPPVDEYLRAQQQCGKSLQADYIFKETMKWLRKIKCAGAVSKQLVEQYAMSVARWIQTEELISECGFLAKHPTTGQAMASPYVRMSQDYMKQINQIWYQIYQIVKENCGEGVLGNSDDPMERLLKQRGG